MEIWTQHIRGDTGQGEILHGTLRHIRCIYEHKPGDAKHCLRMPEAREEGGFLPCRFQTEYSPASTLTLDVYPQRVEAPS